MIKMEENLLRELIRDVILKERYLTLPTRDYNSWQWYSSGGDMAEDEIDEDEEETLE